MRKFRNQIAIVLFFVIIIIASCITFNEILASTINFWGKTTIHQLKSGADKKKALLILFSKKKLEYVVSNESNHYDRYKYTMVNDSTHILVLQKNRAPIFSRGESEFIDSILITSNLCVKMSCIPSRNNRTNDNRYFRVYKKEENNIYEYYIKYSENNKFKNLPLIKIATLLQEENIFTISKEVQLEKTIPIITTPQENTLDLFFRKNIMSF
jgi:hypothetical protein